MQGYKWFGVGVVVWLVPSTLVATTLRPHTDSVLLDQGLTPAQQVAPGALKSVTIDLILVNRRLLAPPPAQPGQAATQDASKPQPQQQPPPQQQPTGSKQPDKKDEKKEGPATNPASAAGGTATAGATSGSASGVSNPQSGAAGATGSTPKRTSKPAKAPFQDKKRVHGQYKKKP